MVQAAQKLLHATNSGDEKVDVCAVTREGRTVCPLLQQVLCSDNKLMVYGLHNRM